jgi:hypothetical protein
MLLLKRMALAVMLSGFSETAIAQQTLPPAQPAAPATPHSEPWNSKYGEAHGVHVFESITRALARDEAEEFLFVLGAPRIQWTGQMAIDPAAIG